MKIKDNQYNSASMVKVYVIELACLIDQLKQQSFSETQKEQLLLKAHSLLEEIPILVKNK